MQMVYFYVLSVNICKLNCTALDNLVHHVFCSKGQVVGGRVNAT